jgi:ABC-2 type transport system permease protein
MINLIKKELTANIKYMIMGFAFFILYAFLFANNGSSLFMLCLIILFYSTSTTNLIMDERYKIDLLVSALPIRRKDIVISKYIMVLLVFIAGYVLYTILSLVESIDGYSKITSLNFLSSMLGLFSISLFNGIMLPLCYRFGSQSTRYISLGIFFVFFFLSNFLGGTDITKFIGFIGSLSSIQGGLLLIVGTLLISVISYAVTYPIYAKKDF